MAAALDGRADSDLPKHLHLAVVVRLQAQGEHFDLKISDVSSNLNSSVVVLIGWVSSAEVKVPLCSEGLDKCSTSWYMYLEKKKHLGQKMETLQEIKRNENTAMSFERGLNQFSSASS